MGYAHLYRESTDYDGLIEAWLITDKLQPDMQGPLAATGIIWREV